LFFGLLKKMGFRLLRFTNTIILIATVILTITGVFGLFWTLAGWMFDVHRLAGWVLIACIPWKTAISFNSIKRGLSWDFDRGFVVISSLLLSIAAFAALFLGVAWTVRWEPGLVWLGQTVIAWHWLIGLGLLPAFALHTWRRWPRPHKPDLLSRRAALKMLTLGGAALVFWQTNETLARKVELPRSPRRYTGSRLEGYFSGTRYPVTQAAGEGEQPVDIEGWRLGLDGAVYQPLSLAYTELASMPLVEKVATIDCTLGWYSLQHWIGLSLTELLKLCGVSPLVLGMQFESVTGYSRFLPFAESSGVLLATQVGEDPLDHSHGFPLRAVVPSRRGWYWVKWLTAIHVIGLPPNSGAALLPALPPDVAAKPPTGAYRR
jgi:DMSO/TMAO reductase YedYZ molybdopterin-dependent catalytic subunit